MSPITPKGQGKKEMDRLRGLQMKRQRWVADEVEGLHNTFAFHPPANQDQVRSHEQVRAIFSDLASELAPVMPEGRAWAVVKTKLEEAEMWAHKAIALTSPATRDKRLEP